MADPVTIFGSVSAILGIIEIIGKMVIKLQELRMRWKEAEFMFLSLVTQLSALRSALSKIQEWMSTAQDQLHHHLVMDLEASILCCDMLIEKMDIQVSELYQAANITLPIFQKKGRLKFIAKRHELENLQSAIERQTSTLTLLLIACNCKTISDQKILHQKPATRKVLNSIRDDTTSLYVHPDNTSISIVVTDNLSKLSFIFQFDRKIFVTRVYERAFRGSVKDNLRRKQGGLQFENSELLDRTLCVEHNPLSNRRPRHKHSPKSSTDEIMGILKSTTGYYTEERMRSLTPEITKIMIEATREVLPFAIQFIHENKNYNAEHLFEELGTVDLVAPDITLDAVDAVLDIWFSSEFMEPKNTSRHLFLLAELNYKIQLTKIRLATHRCRITWSPAYFVQI